MEASGPIFVGAERRRLVDELLVAFDQVAGTGVPMWWSLEAPPGWGKTRLVQEFYGRLAARQRAPGYWPVSILPLDAEVEGAAPASAEAARKRVAPDARRALSEETPEFFWWGISCLTRSGVEFEALIADLNQFEVHRAGLERRWGDLVSRRERLKHGVLGRRNELIESGVGEAVGALAGAANLAVPGLGLLLLLGKWGVQKARKELGDPVGTAGPAITAGGTVAEELAPALERLGNAGLPLVVVVEDVHDADVTLVDLLTRLIAAQGSRVLLVTTSWPGLLTESDRAATQLSTRVPSARIHRVRAGTEACDLSTADLTAMARESLPVLDAESARLIALRFANPWALQTACRLGVVRRSAARAVLTPEVVAGLPEDVTGLFEQLWRELPEPLREALMLAVLAAPTSVGATLNFGEASWDPALLQEAVAVEGWLREQAGPLLRDLDAASDAYSWVRTVEQWLQQFHDPAQRDVALHAAQVEYTEADRRALYGALADAVRTSTGLDEVRQRHADRLVVTLAAQDLLEAPDVVLDAASRLCLRLAGSPTVADQRLLIDVSTLVLDRGGASDDPRLLGLRSLQADALGGTGQVAAACAVLQGLLTDRLRVLGAGAPDTLKTRHTLAVFLGQAGRVEEAIGALQDLLTDQLRVLGADAPDTLKTRHTLAVFLGQVGRVDEAIGALQDLLTDRLRVLGPEAPDTLKNRQSLANLLGDAERTEEAILATQDLLTDQLRVLGPDAPDTLRTREFLAYFLGVAWRGDEAVGACQDLLTDQLRVLGPNAPDTLKNRENLASFLGVAGRVEEAIGALQDLLPDRLRVLGPDAPDTLRTREYLAYWLVEAGRVDEAIGMLEDLISDRIRVLGPDAPDTLETQRGLESLLGESEPL